LVSMMAAPRLPTAVRLKRSAAQTRPTIEGY
jgi:hypothetical protein